MHIVQTSARSRTTRWSSLAACAFILSATSGEAQDPPGPFKPVATGYEHNEGGIAKGFHVDANGRGLSYQHNLRQLGDLRHEMTRIAVDEGYRVRLCTSEGGYVTSEGGYVPEWNGQYPGGGTGVGCQDFFQGSHLVGDLNDKVVFVQTARAGNPYRPIALMAFENNWGPWDSSGWRAFYEGIYRSRDFGQAAYGELGPGVKHDQITALIVSPGYRVRMCFDEGAGPDGGGKCGELGEGAHDNLGEFSFEISFLRVWRVK